MLIAEFFAHQDVFITGGSGFIGKALIEKLLRSCPDIGNIYLLIRSKRGINAEERLRNLLAEAIFDRLSEKQPDILSKVHVIDGDCAELGLGIRAEDRLKLQNVSIVFHSAASVRFDDDLRDAIFLNTRGTYELVKIAESFKQLKVFVHISTTYCNPDKYVVEEKIYPPYADWRLSIRLAETYSTEMLNILNLKYSKSQPNTYCFTKSMGEQVINEYKDKLPVIIVRPSIVFAALEEPCPGWIDNFNGPVGILVACALGIMRTNYSDPDVVSDYIPVDIVIRSIIVAAYSLGTTKRHTGASLNVYNCCLAEISSIKQGDLIEYGKKCIYDNPLERMLWVPGGSPTKCFTWNMIRVFTLQILPAILVDTLMQFRKRKPFLLKIQRRIFATNVALHIFSNTTWIFKNDNFIALNTIVPSVEFDSFAFYHLCKVDFYKEVPVVLRGAKKYLFKDPPYASKKARRLFTIISFIDLSLKLILCFLFVHFLATNLYQHFSEFHF